MKRSIRAASLGVVAAALLLTTAACSSSEPASTTTSAEASGNVVDVAVSAGSFTVLTQLLTATGLDETLAGAGPFTVFAPTDAAFEAVAAKLGVPLDDMVNGLLADPELLTDMLLYHVVPGNIPAADVVTLNGQDVESLSGETWAVIVNGEAVSIEDGFGRIVNVIDVDVPASNGVIHILDSVLEGALPDFSSEDQSLEPTTPDASPYSDEYDGATDKTIVQDLVSAGTFTVLVKLLNAAGLEETLSGPGPFTVFAPTDAAFEAVAADLGVNLDGLLNAVTADPALLTDILLYHVVSGKIPAADVAGLNGKKVETLSGEGWTVIVDGDTVRIEDGYGRIANVIDVDVKASNGVIHVVDKVLEGAVPGE
jgi:transforming growth factor-beta-induced protein